MKVFPVVAFLIVCSHVVPAQTGPGGVGNASNNVLWLSGDYGVYSNSTGTTPAADGNNVALWEDRSGNDKHAIHSLSAQQPNLETNVANGLPAIRFTSGNGDRLLADGVATGNAASVWAVARWFSLPSQNPGIIHAAPPGEAFSGSTSTKVIGMWVNNASERIWGRGVQSNGTQVNLPQNVTTTVNTFYSFLSRYDGTSGITQYVNETIAGSVGYDGTLAPWSAFGIGRQADEGWDGDIAEVIAYNTAVNEAQRIIINNYLAAKYNLALSQNDFYKMDDAENGNYDHDVAGIGRVDAVNQHTDARGSGIVRVLNATNLDDDEFLLWGHDGGALQASVSTGIPSGITARFERIWRVSESGNVGNVDIQFDLTGLSDFAAMSPCDVSLQLGLLIDVDNDNDFSDQTPIFGATPVGANTYRFANVAAIGNETRFTLAVLNAPGTGPGGVGTTDGTSSLKLWYRPDSGVEVTGASVDRWLNAAGVAEHDVSETGTQRPTLVAGANGFNAISFDGGNRLRTGLTLTTSNFVTNQASSFVVNRPDNATQASCVYTTDPLMVNRFANHIPWSNTVVFDLGDWNDPSGRLEIAAPADITSRYSLWTYSAHPTAGKQLFRDGALLQSRPGTDAYANHATERFNIGGNTSGTPGYQGDLAEIAVYTASVNTAQRILIQNYFAAKYDLPLNADDVYPWDNPANSNFDFDVAGIGRTDASNMHTDAQGSGIVRMYNPSDLQDNEFLMWGHNNGPMETTTMDVPPGLQGRLSRVWRISESNLAGAAVNTGTIDIQFDLSGLDPITASDLRLLIDNDGDGIFSEAGTIQKAGAIVLACNRFLFQAVPGNEVTHGDRITIGTINLSQTPLPIELRDFTARMVEGNAQLAWVTLTERGNHFFTIERSIDGKHFHAVAEVDGAGTTRQTTHYTFEDTFPPYGVLYYRLKQTDFDLFHSYSDVIRVENKAVGTQLIAIPNPVPTGERFKLRVKHTERVDLSSAEVRAFDLMGHTVAVSTMADGGDLLVGFPETSAPGLYLITVAAPQQAPLSVRIIVK